MSEDHIFRGRRFSNQEIALIKVIAEKYRHETRTKISRMICEAINWRQPN